MKISEFARMNHVTPKMLRHYDEIGLFCPAFIDSENGYRHYTPEQSHQLFWIITLKGLDFSLEEIRTLISGPVDSAKFIEALAFKRMEIAAHFRQSMIKSLQLDHILSIVKQEGFDMNKTIDLSTLTSELIFDIKKNMPNMEMLLEKAQMMLSQALTGSTYAFLRIDLRQFRAVNDIDGYDVGDKVIVSLYRCIEQTIAEVELESAIARAGGDEFVTFIQGPADLLKTVVSKIKSSVEDIDYKSIGCHKPVDVYIGAVIASASGDFHLRELIDETYDALKLAHADITSGGKGIKLIEKTS